MTSSSRIRISKPTYTYATRPVSFFFSERGKIQFGEPYLVKVCAGVRGYAFDDLHVLDEELAIGLDLGEVGAILPARTESGVDQALSPGRVEACRLGVHAGHLSASDKAKVTMRILRTGSACRECGKTY
jgi:hypothetical protein